MNQFVLWNDCRLFWGSNPQAVAKHYHPVVQLVMATEGYFLSKDANGQWQKKKALLIAPNHLHECDATGVHILSLDIDPESDFGEWILQHQLKEKTISEDLSAIASRMDYQKLSAAIQQNNWRALREQIEHLFSFRKLIKGPHLDERVQEVLDFIAQNIDQPIDSKMLMEVAHLSESRLLHLFKSEMGLPIRNYILWYRLKVVLQQIVKGRSLTEAAYEAGFSDQAHLSRTSVRMIGIPPSVLIKNSKFIQVSYPE